MVHIQIARGKLSERLSNSEVLDGELFLDMTTEQSKDSTDSNANNETIEASEQDETSTE